MAGENMALRDAMRVCCRGGRAQAAAPEHPDRGPADRVATGSARGRGIRPPARPARDRAVRGRRHLLGQQRQGRDRARLRHARSGDRRSGCVRAGDDRDRVAATVRQLLSAPSRTLPPWPATSRCSNHPRTPTPHRPEMPSIAMGGGLAGLPAADGSTALRRHPDWIRARMPSGENYHDLKGHAPRPGPQHGLRGGPLPEHRGVLGPAHRHDHDPGRHVHPGVRVLRGQDRPADLVRRRRAAPRRGGDRPARPRARGRHQRRPRRPARRRLADLRRDDHGRCARPRRAWASRS